MCQKDDVLQKIDGKEIKTEKDLQEALDKVSERIHITVLRPSSKETVEFRGLLKKAPGQDGKQTHLFLPTDQDWKVDLKKFTLPSRRSR